MKTLRSLSGVRGGLGLMGDSLLTASIAGGGCDPGVTDQ
jgi:hypothetical protein